MSTLVRRRALLRAVAIGAGAYYDAELRYEALRLAEILRAPKQGGGADAPSGPAGAERAPSRSLSSRSRPPSPPPPGGPS